jgi:nucleotide-binding universal stress UspA family protein
MSTRDDGSQLTPREIVVASDLSVAAANAAWRAAQLARALGATLRLLHGPAHPRHAEAARTSLLRLAQSVHHRLGVAADVEIAQGNLALGALTAGLLVVPARDRRTLRERITGTSTERFVRASRIPVLVVKRPIARARDGTAPAPSAKDLYDRVLACVDLGAASASIIAAARSVSADPRMEVLHVVQPRGPAAAAKAADDHPGTAVERARAAVQQHIAQAGFPAGSARASVGFGLTGPTLVARERARGADLVVLGKHGRGLLAEWLHGGLLREVLCATRCDVLLVPPLPRSASGPGAMSAPGCSALG